MRIGAVNYLNSKPLVYGLESLAPNARVTYDLPSRLADSLAAGRLDVALVPSVEFFRAPGHRIVSDACVACRGPVLSVKLHFRVRPWDVRRVALDEGSRTSAALTQILLAELFGVRPSWEPLPIGCGPETTDADAVLLIGDRAIADCGLRTTLRSVPTDSTSGGEPNPQSEIRNPKSAVESMHSPGPRPRRESVEVWDLGERWVEWTGLPFVFAMWIAREETDVREAEGVLSEARDAGLRHSEEIAEREGPLVYVSPEVAKAYFRKNLHFSLGSKERAGLRRFYELCVKHELAPPGREAAIGEVEKKKSYC